MEDSEKREKAMVLASSRRISARGFSENKPCRICGFDNDVKSVIEALLGTGIPSRKILDLANSVIQVRNPGERDISMRTLEQHRKNHISIKLYMQREILERRAIAASKDIEQEDGSILTPAAYAEIMMNAGAENLIDNPSLVSPMEGLAAAKTLHDFDSNDNANLDVARMTSQLNKIILAIKAVCTGNQIETIVNMINSETKSGDNDVDVL